MSYGPDSNRASHENQRARENIVMERSRRRNEALDLEEQRWPYRAVEAGVAAKLARRFAHWAGRAVSGGGSLSW